MWNTVRQVKSKQLIYCSCYVIFCRKRIYKKQTNKQTKTKQNKQTNSSNNNKPAKVIQRDMLSIAVVEGFIIQLQHSDPLHASTREYFIVLYAKQKGTLISSYTVPHRGNTRTERASNSIIRKMFPTFGVKIFHHAPIHTDVLINSPSVASSYWFCLPCDNHENIRKKRSIF